MRARIGVFVAILFVGGLASLGLASDKTAKPDPFIEGLARRLLFVFRDYKLSKQNFGVEVYSLSRQERVFALNPEAPLMPASAVKLLTGLVALKRLGPDFTYKTELFLDKKPQGAQFEGDLCLKGGGDPSLVTERLYLLAAEFLRSGVRQINGNILVDDWAFDQELFDPQRIPSETDRPYNAPVGALSFNYNSTTLYFRPAARVGDALRVFVEPDTGYVKVINQAKTGARSSKITLSASRVRGGKDGDEILIKGSLPLGGEEQRRYFNIVSPAHYSGHALKMMLKEKGIGFVSEPKILHQACPSNALKVGEIGSLPMRDIVALMNKYSNNFIADAVVKTLGMELKGRPGSMAAGLEILNEESLRLGLQGKGFQVVSGSGLTRNNRMSAEQFVLLLNASYIDFEVLPELLASLPIAGRDGTLKRRMIGTQAYGRLRAKTGSIDGVVSLVGVVQTRGGELLSFAVLINDSNLREDRLRSWQDQFGQALAEFNRKVPLSQEGAKPLPTMGVPQ